MTLSPDAEEALELAMEAAAAIEEASVRFGPHSEEARLARLAYQQWTEEYQTVTHQGRENVFWDSHCLFHPEARGCRDYDV